MTNEQLERKMEAAAAPIATILQRTHLGDERYIDARDALAILREATDSYDELKRLALAATEDAERNAKRLAEAQESRLVEGTFAWALEQMKAGKRVARTIWPRGNWISFRGIDGGLIDERGRAAFLRDGDLLEATDWRIAAPPEPSEVAE